MKALEEYMKWCDGYSPSTEQRKAYITGFNRAVELIELFLKEKQNETNKCIS
jgi:hypothetical protein